MLVEFGFYFELSGAEVTTFLSGIGEGLRGRGFFDGILRFRVSVDVGVDVGVRLVIGGGVGLDAVKLGMAIAPKLQVGWCSL